MPQEKEEEVVTGLHSEAASPHTHTPSQTLTTVLDVTLPSTCTFSKHIHTNSVYGKTFPVFIMPL